MRAVRTDPTHGCVRVQSSRRARVLALAMLCAPLVAHADVPPEATALFDQGIKDMRAGNLEVACKELAASLAKYADSGTKGALATCYGKLGKVVSAWSLWKDLADTASPADRADAAKRAKALEPRLPHYVVKLAGVTAGLVVTVNGNPLADPTLPVPLPIDPGPLAVVARAPGRTDWSQTFQATEGATTAIEIPVLAAPAVGEPVKPTFAVADHVGDARHRRHLIAIAVGVGGVAAMVAGGLFGSAGFSNFSQAKTDCGGDVDRCTPGGLAAAKSDVANARSDATLSTVAFSVGGILAATAAILWFTAPDAESGVHVTPAVDSHAAGLVFSGRW